MRSGLCRSVPVGRLRLHCYLRRWNEDLDQDGNCSGIIRRETVRLADKDHELHEHGVPGGLCHERLHRLQSLRQILRGRPPCENSFRGFISAIPWTQMHEAERRADVQCPRLPQRLHHVRLVKLECVQHDLRGRNSVQYEGRGHKPAVWWRCVQRHEDDSPVRPARVPRALHPRRGDLEPMLGVLRLRRPILRPDRSAAAAALWQCLRSAHPPCVRHGQTMPGGLPPQRLVDLLRMLNIVRRWNQAPSPHGFVPAPVRRCRVRGHHGHPALRRPRRLVVGLVCLQQHV